MTYGDEQQQLISTLKEKVAECRQQYKELKQMYHRPGAMEVWQFIEPAVVAEAEFYKGEILRCRHNIARYMLGRDPQPGRKISEMWVDMLNSYIHDMPDDLQRMEEDWQSLKAHEDDGNETSREFWKANYELGNSLYDLSANQIKDLTAMVRKEIYAGTV